MIEPHREYAEGAAILGEDYAGFLVHDGAHCFYGFERAFHQSCLEHLVRRCREMIQTASPAAAQFPLAVKTLLQQGLQLRDRYQQGEVSPYGLAVATGRLEAHLDRSHRRHSKSSSATCQTNPDVCLAVVVNILADGLRRLAKDLAAASAKKPAGRSTAK